MKEKNKNILNNLENSFPDTGGCWSIKSEKNDPSIYIINEYKYKGYYIIKFSDGFFRIKKIDDSGKIHHCHRPSTKDLRIARNMVDGLIYMNG